MISNQERRVLITGASGLLGGNILNLLPKSWNVVGVVNKHGLAPINKKITIAECDLSNLCYDKLFEQYGPFDFVIHTAALADVDRCEEDKDLAYKLNVVFVKSISDFCKIHDAFLLHISSDHVFDGNNGNYSENDKTGAVNYYAETKLLAEQEIKKSGINYAIIRTNFFGYNIQQKDDIAGWMVNSLRSGMPIRLFNDVFFSPILINYLAEYIFEIVERKDKGIFHLAASDSCSKYDFGMKLAKIFNLDDSLITAISVDSSCLSVKRPKNMSLDVSAAVNKFKRKLPSIDESILKYKQLYENNYQNKLRELFLGK